MDTFLSVLAAHAGELLGPGGMNRTSSFNASGHGESQAPAQMSANVGVFRRVWAAKRLPPCGAAEAI